MMRIINYSIFVLSIVLSLGLVSFRVSPSNIRLPNLNINAAQKAQAVIPGIPQLLSIPKINVNAKVEQVGLDASNNMDVPKDVNNAGWYRLGYKPGENGSAVIDGHLDSQTGPAIFYQLSQLILGDEITVTDNNGKNFVFSVVDKKNYPSRQLPLSEIFGKQNFPQLVLITCEGTFDRLSQNYSNRTVVTANLIKIN